MNFFKQANELASMAAGLYFVDEVTFMTRKSAVKENIEQALQSAFTAGFEEAREMAAKVSKFSIDSPYVTAQEILAIEPLQTRS